MDNLTDALIVACINLLVPVNFYIQHYFIKKTNRVQPSFNINNLLDISIFSCIVIIGVTFLTLKVDLDETIEY